MKVVVCDDDPVSRMAVIDLMKSFSDLEVVEASDGEEGWALLQEAVPLLCCSDIQMPRLSGIELLRRARATRHLEKLPFVMISSASDKEVVVEAIKLGAIDYILKPFEFQQAREHMTRVLQRVWNVTAEQPNVTLKRLGLSPDKLDRYYHAFEAQIDKVSAELAAHAAGQVEETLRLRLPGLVTACVTLGFWRGESALQGLIDAPASKVQVFGVLASIRAMIRHQLDHVRYT